MKFGQFFSRPFYVQGEVPSNFSKWSREKQASFLRHPFHEKRCLCKRYGFVGVTVIDNYGFHHPDRCQPHREVIQDPIDPNVVG
jgi:hypothetical protein